MITSDGLFLVPGSSSSKIAEEKKGLQEAREYPKPPVDPFIYELIWGPVALQVDCFYATYAVCIVLHDLVHRCLVTKVQM